MADRGQCGANLVVAGPAGCDVPAELPWHVEYAVEGSAQVQKVGVAEEDAEAGV
jgi:hypothetical protein